LFANTLLNDDFSKDVDFDSLGLDNLQLNLVSTTNHTNTQTTIATDNNNSTTILPHSSSNNSNSNDLLNSCINSELIDSSNKSSISSSSKIIISSSDLIFPLQITNENKNLIDVLNTPNNPTIASNESSTDSNQLLIQLQQPVTGFVDENNDDDKLFKKPLNDHLIANNRRESSVEQKQIINLFQSIDLVSSSTSLESTTNNSNNSDNKNEILNKTETSVINLNELKNQLKSLKKPSLSTSQSSSSGCFSSPSTLNKILSLKRSRKQRTKLANNSNSSNLNAGKLTKDDEFYGKSSPPKFFNIKQTKLLASASSFMNKSNNKKSDSKITKDKLKQIKKNAESSSNNNNNNIVLLNLSALNNKNSPSNLINFEPLSKKFAVDNEIRTSNNDNVTLVQNKSESSLNELNTDNNISNNNNNNNNNYAVYVDNSTLKELIKNNNILIKKKDEVDLDIKDLSLLDLHSSEDDSAVDFLIK
jgi:hypothetical protein